MANKMTKRDYFNILRECYPVDAENYEAVIGFIDHELELLAKKNAADRKPTAVQVANEGIKQTILDCLTTTPTTISDLQKSNGALGELSNQRVSALIRQLVADGAVVRTEEKRKAYFSIAVGE